MAVEDDLDAKSGGCLDRGSGDLPQGHAPRTVHDLEEDLVLPDHAELEARPLLDRLEALLQIAHLRVECGVACLERVVLLALRRELPVVLPDAHPAALAEPERVLD